MKLKNWLANITILFFTLLISFVLIEFVVFTMIFKTSDAIPNAYINDVVRYQPNTTARIYNDDGGDHKVMINKEGWNSTKSEYREAKTLGVKRIAVVGDSYAQAAAVNYDQGFGEVIEQHLKNKGYANEVFRFGIDGAPLSQYLYMMRKEVSRFHPDIVVVQLIHNDFDESYRFLHGRYSSSFMKIKQKDGQFQEVEPESYEPGLVDFLKNFRTWRYLYYQTGVAGQVRRLINLVRSPDETKQIAKPKYGFVQSAIDVRNIQEQKKISNVTSYILKEMKKLSEQQGFKLVIAMDGLREAVYSGETPEDYEAYTLNQIAAKEAENLGLDYIDLHKVFSAHYKANQKKFEFPTDWHWNKLGHYVAGTAIANHIHKMSLPKADAVTMQQPTATE